MPEYSAQQLLETVNSSYTREGNERIRKIAERINNDIFQIMLEFNVTHDELWAFVRWANELGRTNQVGLLAAGIGLERLIDIMNDERDRAAGRAMGTPRAIEGPLYVPGAPQSKHEARMDDGSEDGPLLIMEGTVRDTAGKAIPGAVVDVWQANQRGTYSFVDPTQSEYNYRRRIEADENGHYRFRSMVPPGYSVPPDCPTQTVLQLLGRDGNRPAHIHFMITAPGYETLTTQVNMPNDQHLNTDFAFGTREELIVELKQVSDAGEMARFGLDKPFTHITFDFVMQPSA